MPAVSTRDRRLACAVAAILLVVSLWAPWFHETVSARALTGTSRLGVAESGWSALSGAEAVALLLGLAALLCPPGRRPRASAAIVLAGATEVVLLLVKVVDHGAAVSPPARVAVGVGWGLWLALLATLALTVLTAGGLRRGPGGGRRAPGPGGEAPSAAARARERQRARDAATGRRSPSLRD